MIGRIKNLVIKEFIQTLRDRKMRFLLFGPPVIQLLLFGYVVTTDVNNISTAYYDLDKSQESRELQRRLESSGYFSVNYAPESPDEIKTLLDKGKVLCTVQVDPGFSRDLKKGIPTAIQVIVDGTDSNTAMIAMNYATQIVTRYALERAAPSIAVNTAKIDFRTRYWFNPDLKSRNYNVPGVIASIIMLICLRLTSMAVVREREAGTMEQLMVTPIRPAELMLGKTIPFAIIGFADMALVTAAGVFWFDVPIKGSLMLLLIGTSVYLLSVLGIGLFISTISKTQQQALMATIFFYMPAMLLSGFMFPVENMPVLFQYLTYLNPLRYFLVIIRGIFLKGNGLDILWPQIAALLVLGVVVITISSLRFKKRLL
jgi:ABC-2 type transport system permease protein